MTNIIFIHGTGVRQPVYETTFAIIKNSLSSRMLNVNLIPCLWGETHGVRLHGSGMSIPNYDRTRSPNKILPEDEELVAWQLLYIDPLYELRQIAFQSGEAKLLAPNQIPPWRELQTQLYQFMPSPELMTLIEQVLSKEIWDKAFQEITNAPDFIDSIRSITSASVYYRSVVARAIVANAQVLSIKEGFPALDGSIRDRLVILVVAQLGGDARAVPSWLIRPIKGLIMQFVTNRTARKRGVLSDSWTPFPGDILYYQTRGDRQHHRTAWSYSR